MRGMLKWDVITVALVPAQALAVCIVKVIVMVHVKVAVAAAVLVHVIHIVQTHVKEHALVDVQEVHTHKSFNHQVFLRWEILENHGLKFLKNTSLQTVRSVATALCRGIFSTNLKQQ